MVSIVILGITIALMLYRMYKYCTYRPPNFPPGPPRIPLFGSYLLLFLINRKSLHKAILKLCDYYNSKVIGFYVGSFLVVVANDYKSVKEMLVRQEFDGRPDIFGARLREPHFQMKGIFFTENLYWRDQRRFTLRHLRDFGFGRRYQDFEIEVGHEMQSLVNLIKEGPKYEHEHTIMKNGLVCLPNILISSLGNCFLQVICGERLTRVNQHKILKAGLGGMDFQKQANEYGNMYSIIPWIVKLFPNASNFNATRNGSMDMCVFMKEIISKQVQTYQDGHIRHFMDMYIKEVKKAEDNGEKSGFLYDQMLIVCVDFLFPSLTAMEVQLAFLFKQLMYHPQIAKRIQNEIDLVVGNGRLPELDDRIHLPYTEATLREILRFETLVPSSVSHKALLNANYMGYDIPKDTYLLPGLFAFHNEEELWKDPHVFRPDRFLDMHGNLSLKKDVSLPFGAGKRLCAGETFARNTMFLCLSALMQNFNIEPKNSELPRLDDVGCGLVRFPKDFWVRMEAR